MISANTLRILLAHGLGGEALIEAVQAIEDDMDALLSIIETQRNTIETLHETQGDDKPKPSTERVRKYRERMKHENETPETLHETLHETQKVSPPDAPLLLSPTPPNNNPPLTPPAKSARQKPKSLEATTLDDLKPWMAEKQAEGISFAGIEPKIELEKCKQHFLGKTRNIGTARNWLLNAVSFAKERGGGKPSPQKPRLPQASEWAAQ